jgi:NADH-ubiquinone oxidoreductase chain 6
MNNLFLINETFTNGYISNVLDIISLLAILCGILVIVNKNPIISVLFLIGLFASISSYLILTGLSFIGLSYLIVYIGAVSILFLFILMLINIRISELQSNTSNSIFLSFIVIVSLNYILFQILPYNISSLNNNFKGNNIDNIIFVTSKA